MLNVNIAKYLIENKNHELLSKSKCNINCQNRDRCIGYENCNDLNNYTYYLENYENKKTSRLL